MKIAVTGCSKGLGKAVADYFTKLNHSVIALDKNRDLRDWSIRQNLYKEINDCDVFFNIAKPDFIQTEIVYELYELWQNQSKTIVSIGSKVVEYPHWGDTIEMMKYHTQKKSLEHATQQLQKLNKNCKVILINPDHLYDKKNINYQHLENWCIANLGSLYGC